MCKIANNDTITTFGEKIRFFRNRARMSQMDIEVEADIAYGTVSKIERNLIDPTKETIHKIAIALNLSGKEIADLFDINLYSKDSPQNEND